MEYTGPVSELKEMCEIRIEVAGMYQICSKWFDLLI